MASAIAGSAILFAYASSDGSAHDGATATSEAESESVMVEEIVEKPVYIDRIKYVNQTVEVEKPVYINRTVDVEKEVPAYFEKPPYIHVNETDNSSISEPDRQKEKENDLPDEQELQDIIPKDVLDLLDNVMGLDDDDEKDNDDDDKEDDTNEKENKGKGKHGRDHDD